jgi:hypothetical protein
MTEPEKKQGVLRLITRVAIVRLILLFVAMVAVDVGIALIPQVALKKGDPNRDLLFLACAALAWIVMPLAYWGLVRLIERRSPRELALGPAPGMLILGIAIGAALFSAVYAVLWARGFAHYHGIVGYSGLMAALGVSLISAIGEELVFRGVIFRLFEDSFGTLVAVVISAAVFGLLHAANPGATVASTAAIALEAGILLALAYAATRSLWLPIGLHFAWNFTEGGVFGAQVSGGTLKGILDFPLSGPELWTGGKFGPEASVIAVAICMVAAAIFGVITVRTGNWRPLKFRMLLD